MNKYPESLHARCRYLEGVVASLSDICKSNDKYIADLRLDLKIQSELIEKSEDHSRLWLWQGDGYDYLRSMSGDLPVLIRAAELRHLVEHGETVAEENGSEPVQNSNPVFQILSLADDLIEEYPFLYFEIARTRQTDWMVWLRKKPEGELIASGQGLTPAEACQDALRLQETIRNER